MSAHCKSIYDKYIERFNSLMSRHIHRNYRVSVSDIQQSSQIVLEVDKFMKKLEKEVRETRSGDNDVDDDDHASKGDRDTDKNTKILEGKRYKDTIEKVGEWHKGLLRAVLEKEQVYEFLDQWSVGVSQIQEQIDLYDKYLKKRVGSSAKQTKVGVPEGEEVEQNANEEAEQVDLSNII